MVFQCWPTVFDAGPTLKQHWVNAPCLLGFWLRLVVIVDQARCYGTKPFHYHDLTWKRTRTKYGEIFNIIFIILTFIAISSKSVALKKCPKLFVWFNLSPIVKLFFCNWRHALKKQLTTFHSFHSARIMLWPQCCKLRQGYRIQNITQTLEFWQPTAEINVIESFRF